MDGENTISCVVVGDQGVGKTCLLQCYTRGSFPASLPAPTICDTYSINLQVAEKEYILRLWDTAGTEEFEGLRQVCYERADVFIVCYSLAKPASANNAVRKWIPEVRRHRPSVPVVLVATQTDLRGCPRSLSRLERSPGTRRSLRRQSEAHAYTECSALTGLGVKDVFDEAVLAALLPRHKKADHHLLRERIETSARVLRKSSRRLSRSLSRQRSRSVSSIREACLRSELGLGLSDRIRAWVSKTFTRTRKARRKETIIW